MKRSTIRVIFFGSLASIAFLAAWSPWPKLFAGILFGYFLFQTIPLSLHARTRVTQLPRP